MRPALLFTTLLALSTPSSAREARFTLSSPDIAARSSIAPTFVFNSFGCTGQNLSPALEWSGIPTAAKSLALIVHDPDAKTGVGGFTHWLVYNLPLNTTGLERGAGGPGGAGLPRDAAQSATSFGTPGWGGPCPPAGEKAHRYVFTLYALGVERLELPQNASQAFVGFNIVGNALAKTSFTALYGR